MCHPATLQGLFYLPLSWGPFSGFMFLPHAHKSGLSHRLSSSLCRILESFFLYTYLLPGMTPRTFSPFGLPELWTLSGTGLSQLFPCFLGVAFISRALPPALPLALGKKASIFSTALAGFQSQRAEVGVQVIPSWRCLMQIGFIFIYQREGQPCQSNKRCCYTSLRQRPSCPISA